MAETEKFIQATSFIYASHVLHRLRIFDPGPSGEDSDIGSGKLAMSDRRVQRKAPGSVDVAGSYVPRTNDETVQRPSAATVMHAKGAVMPKRRANGRSRVKQTMIASTFDENAKDEWLDAIVSSAAMVARADGWVQEVERCQLLDFVGRHQLFLEFKRDEVLAQFERRIRDLREPDGPLYIFRRLGRCTDHVTATLILSVAGEVAAADSRLDPREEQLLRLIHGRLMSQRARCSLSIP